MSSNTSLDIGLNRTIKTVIPEPDRWLEIGFYEIM